MKRRESQIGHLSKQGIGDEQAPRGMAWKVVRNHVCPVNDLREHLLTDCWCGPTDDDGLVVHNSLDGREFYERGERKPS
jgi:hypothetical protein